MKKNKMTLLLLTIVLIGFGALSCAAYLGDWFSTGIGVNKIVESGEAATLRKQLGDESVTEVSLTGTVKIGGPIAVYGKKTITGDGQLMMDDAYQQDDENGEYLLILEKDAEVSVGGDVVLDGNSVVGCIQVKKDANLTVCDNAILRNSTMETANVWAEGDLTIKGGDLTSATGYNVWSAGRMTLSGGTITGSGTEYAGIYVSGKMTQTGGTIREAGTNVYVAKGGSFVYKNGSNSYAIGDGILVEKNAELKLTTAEAKVRESGHNGITLEGYGIIDDALLYMSGNQQIDIGKEGYLEIKGGDLAYGLGNGIRNRGTVIMTGGAIYGTTIHGVVNSGTMEIKAGEIRDNGRNGIQNKNGGDIKVIGKDIALYNNAYGITNEENADCELAYAQVYNHSANNIRDFGDIYIHDITLKDSYGNCINVAYGGTVKVKNAVIDGTSKNHGIYNTGDSVVELESVTIKNTSSRGIQNKDGKIIGKNVIIENTGGAGLGLVVNEANEKSGSVDIDGLTIRSGAGNNIYLEGKNPGTAVIKNATLHAAKGNNIKVQAGSLSLIDSKVLGNVQNVPNNIHGILSEGGKINLTGVTISKTAGKGIQNKGGIVTAENLTLEDLGTDGIGNKINDNNVTKGSVTVEGLTVKNPKRYTLINECAGTMNITNGTLGDTEANNVVLKSGTMNLTNVIIEGAHRPAGSDAGCHGIYAVKKGSVLNIKDSTIKNVQSDRAIQVRGASVNIDGLTVSEIKGVVIGNDENKEYGGNGKIKISGLISDETCMSHIISNETKGKITIDNSYLTGGSNKKSLIFNSTGATIETGENVEMTGSKRQAVNNQGTMTINGGTIHDNGKESGVSGTAIYNSGKLTINGCSIYNNITAADKTGVINNAKEGENVGKLTINNAFIYNNTSGDVGGAIRTGDTTSLKVTGTVFYRNKSVVEGGAIFAEDGSKVTLSDCTFQKNEAPHGGAIGLKNSDSGFKNTITDCVFEENAVTNKHGGAVYVHGTTTVTISGGSMENNSADNGGAIRAGNDDTVVKVDKVTFKGNTASNEGGAISTADKSKVVLTNSTFEGNTCTKGNDINIGKNGTIDIANCTLAGGGLRLGGDNSKASLKGKMVINLVEIVKETGRITVKGQLAEGSSIAVKPAAWKFGTVIYEAESKVDRDANLGYFSVLKPNPNDEDFELGADLTNEKQAVLVTYVAQIGDTKYETLAKAVEYANANSIADAPVVIEMIANTEVTSQINVTGNVTIQDDGTARMITRSADWDSADGNIIFDVKEGGKLSLTSTSQNKDEVKLTVSGNKEHFTKGLANGWLLRVGTEEEPLAEAYVGIGVELTGNVSKTSGGAAYVWGTLKMEGARVTDNKGTAEGGAIFAKEGSKVTLKDCTFQKNEAQSGGAIGLNIGVSEFENTITDCVFKGNTATEKHGGAVYVHAATTVTISGGSMENNTANNGGAIRTGNDDTLVAVDNVIFKGNAASNEGGAISTADKSKVVLTKGTFESNTCTKGNDINIGKNGTIDIANCTLAGGGLRLGGDNSKANLSGEIVINLVEIVKETGCITVKGQLTEGSSIAVKPATWKLGTVIYETESKADRDANLRYFSVLKTNSTGEAFDVGADPNNEKQAVLVEQVFNFEDSEYVAQIGDTKHETLAAAVEYANTNSTADTPVVIQVIANTEVTSQINITGNVTIQDDGTAHIIARSVDWDGKDGNIIFDVKEGGKLSLTSTAQNEDEVKLTVSGNKGYFKAGLADGWLLRVGTKENSDAYTYVGKGVDLTGSVNQTGGGAAYVWGTLKMEGGRMTYNSSTHADGGGAVYIRKNAVMEAKSGILCGNSSIIGGVAKLVTGATIKLDGTVVTGNTASGNGGALYATGNGTLVELKNITNFSENTSNGHGGAFYAQSQSKLVVSGVTFRNNVADFDNKQGGVMYLKYVKESSIENCTFADNEAKEGGALNLANDDNGSMKLDVTNCTFTENVAKSYGGAVAVSAKGDVTLSGCNFTNNTTKSSASGGDAINIGSGKSAKIADCTMSHNGKDADVPCDIRLGGKNSYISLSALNKIEKVLYNNLEAYVEVKNVLTTESSIGVVPYLKDANVAATIKCDSSEAVNSNLCFFHLVGDEWTAAYQLKVQDSNLVLSKKEEQ